MKNLKGSIDYISKRKGASAAARAQAKRAQEELKEIRRAFKMTEELWDAFHFSSSAELIVKMKTLLLLIKKTRDGGAP
jgi:hypothetical protein